MKYFYVYILKCSDGSYYVGHTDDLDNRLHEHYMGTVPCYTSKKLPVKLVYNEIFSTRDDAFNAERKIKKWSRKKKEALIEQNWNKVSESAKKKFD